MNRNMVLALLLLLLVGIGGYLFTAKPCVAGFCFTGTCFNSSGCGQGCICLKEGMDLRGKCYSVD